MPSTILMRLPAAVALATLIAAGASRPPEAVPACREEIGPGAAAALLKDCRAAGGELAACKTEAPCETVRAEIRRVCEAAGADALPFCERYVAIDDDEEDE